MATNSLLHKLQREIWPDLSSQFPAEKLSFTALSNPNNLSKNAWYIQHKISQQFSLGSCITHDPSPHCRYYSKHNGTHSEKQELPFS